LKIIEYRLDIKQLAPTVQQHKPQWQCNVPYEYNHKSHCVGLRLLCSHVQTFIITFRYYLLSLSWVLYVHWLIGISVLLSSKNSFQAREFTGNRFAITALHQEALLLTKTFITNQSSHAVSKAFLPPFHFKLELCQGIEPSRKRVLKRTFSLHKSW